MPWFPDLYLHRGRVKLTSASARQRQSDKRETLRRKTAELEAERAMAAHR